MRLFELPAEPAAFFEGHQFLHARRTVLVSYAAYQIITMLVA